MSATPPLEAVLVTERDSLVPVVAVEQSVALVVASSEPILTSEDLAVLPRRGSPKGGALIALCALALGGWAISNWTSVSGPGGEQAQNPPAEQPSQLVASLRTSAPAPAAVKPSPIELIVPQASPAKTNSDDASSKPVEAKRAKKKKTERAQTETTHVGNSSGTDNGTSATPLPVALLPEGSSQARFPDLTASAQRRVQSILETKTRVLRSAGSLNNGSDIDGSNAAVSAPSATF